MIRRLNYPHIAPDSVKAFGVASQQLGKDLADPKLRTLLELRVSQINGCGYCVNLHSAELRKLGEHQQRLDCLVAWHETTLFTPREMAGLKYAEAMTLIAGKGVDDLTYENARSHFSDKELVDVTLIIALINAFNRIAISMANAPNAVA